MTATDLRPRRTARPGSEASAGAARGGGPLRQRLLVAAAVVVVLGVIAALIALGIAGAPGGALSPTSTQPDGAKALATVLRQQGVDVRVTSRLSDAQRAADDAQDGASILVYDENAYLDADQWRTLATSTDDLVALTPPPAGLDTLAPAVSASSKELSGILRPSCDLPALAQSTTVLGDGTRYTTDDPEAVRCLPATSGGGFGLVQVPSVVGSGTSTIVGTTSALTNQSIASDDNAAFALALLGRSSTLVWYIPSVDDLPAGTGTLASLTPGWVTPAIGLLMAAGVAAIVWRGRRLGPLVVENLPVVVRASETTEGRARLYQRGASRLHAIDQLRIGAIPRLALLTGLGRTAEVDQVVGRVAEFLRADPRSIRALLVDEVPGDDAALLRLSGELQSLEAAVARAVRPSR